MIVAFVYLGKPAGDVSIRVENVRLRKCNMGAMVVVVDSTIECLFVPLAAYLSHPWSCKRPQSCIGSLYSDMAITLRLVQFSELNLTFN